MRNLIQVRKRTAHLHAATPTRVLGPHNNHVFVFLRPHPLGPLVGIHNFTEEDQRLSAELPRSQGVYNPYDRLSEQRIEREPGDLLRLNPYETLWLTDGP